MTCKNTDAFTLKSIPNVTGPVVVSAEEDTARNGEGDRSNTAQDIVMSECVELSVGANVKETAGGIVGTRRKGISIGEESDDIVSRPSCTNVTRHTRRH